MNQSPQELTIETLDYLTLFNGETIDPQNYYLLHVEAVRSASSFYADHYDPDRDLMDNVRSLGIKEIAQMNGRLHDLYRARALYLPETETIYLYEQDIAELSVMASGLNLCEEDIRQMMIAHELFHHLEYRLDRQLDLLFDKRYGKTPDHHKYREIAAHHFAFLVTGNHPEYLDYLWIKDRDADRLDRHLRYYEELSDHT